MTKNGESVPLTPVVFTRRWRRYRVGDRGEFYGGIANLLVRLNVARYETATTESTGPAVPPKRKPGRPRKVRA